MNALKTNISHEQRKKIFVLSRQAHLSNEELHFYMKDWADVSSLSEGNCSNSQAFKIITNLESILNIRKISFPAPKGSLSEKQLRAILTIKKILKWDDKRLNGFIDHTVEKNDVNTLSTLEASKVIMGLRKMLK